MLWELQHLHRLELKGGELYHAIINLLTCFCYRVYIRTLDKIIIS